MMSQADSESDWHARPLADVGASLETDQGGLASDEAARRLKRYGRNRLPQKPPPSVWQIVVRQFRNPFIYILAGAALLSLLTDRLTDAGFILLILCINALVGAIQEWKAERAAQALQKLLQVRACVERDGTAIDVDAEEVVPGDVVLLESGNRVPVDLRLFELRGLELDESLLTGESLPITKDPEAVLEPSTPVADRSNMTHAGSIVLRGRARGIAVATGGGTAVGKLALDVMGARTVKPPLIVRMERFTRVVAVAIVAAAIAIAAIGIFVRGQDIPETLLFGIALVVSAIPEGLPIAMTVALAIATTRMARRGVIVRRLTAVEGLGSCTYIATDKTGTLTANELTIREIRLTDGTTLKVTGQGFVPEGEVQAAGQKVAGDDSDALSAWTRVAVLCNEGDLHHNEGEWGWHGDPVDLAFLAVGQKLGRQQAEFRERWPEVNKIEFEPERRFAATFHREEGGGASVAVKGAPERVLAMCRMAEADRERHLMTADEMADRGYRVLALAQGKESGDVGGEETPPDPSELEFLGFAGMIDPLRAEAREAVAACLEAGVRVCMVTGDHRVTALAIARDLGFAEEPSEVMTGEEVAAASREELRQAIGRVNVFARVAPGQKLDIVEAAREAGHFVAVTGDGVNDAPALRSAHIGVAMGKAGTDVAREAAELVISDDNFANIVGGIEEGRVAYDNIRNVIYLLISTGAAEIVLVALAVLFATPLPLLPVQLLWLNLVTQGIQDCALAFEPGADGVLERSPRPPTQRIFDKLMIERTVVAAVVMGGVAFAVFHQLLPAGFSPAELAMAQNMVLLLMVLFENVHIGNCRSETRSAFARSPLRSPILLVGVTGAFLAHFAAMHFAPLQKLLGTAPVGVQQWIWLIGLALTMAVAMELHKLSWWWRRRGEQSVR